MIIMSQIQNNQTKILLLCKTHLFVIYLIIEELNGVYTTLMYSKY